jgi:hypothetical protein
MLTTSKLASETPGHDLNFNPFTNSRDANMTTHTHEPLTLEILPNPHGGWTINAVNDAAQRSSTCFSSADLDADPQAMQLCRVVTKLVREHVLGSTFTERPTPTPEPSDYEHFTGMLERAGIRFHVDPPRHGQISVQGPFGISTFDMAGKLLEIEGMQ